MIGRCWGAAGAPLARHESSGAPAPRIPSLYFCHISGPCLLFALSLSFLLPASHLLGFTSPPTAPCLPLPPGRCT